MYSYKLERYKCNQERIKELTRMPLECDLYKAQEGHNFYEDDYGHTESDEYSYF